MLGFDRDKAVESEMPSSEDDPHAARSDFFEGLEAFENRALQGQLIIFRHLFFPGSVIQPVVFD